LSFSSARSELDAPTLLPGVAVVSDTVTADGNNEDVETGPLVPGCPFGATKTSHRDQSTDFVRGSLV
jgi:hypothetical protein